MHVKFCFIFVQGSGTSNAKNLQKLSKIHTGGTVRVGSWMSSYRRDVCHHECKHWAHVLVVGPVRPLCGSDVTCLDSLIGGGAAGVGPAYSLRAPSSQHMGQGDLFQLCGFWGPTFSKDTINLVLVASYHKLTYNLSVWVPIVDLPSFTTSHIYI